MTLPPVETQTPDQLRLRFVTAEVAGRPLPLQWCVSAVVRVAELSDSSPDDVFRDWWAEVRELRPTAGAWA